MAVYGLQVDFMNKLLREYFGLESPTLRENEIYVGNLGTSNGYISPLPLACISFCMKRSHSSNS